MVLKTNVLFVLVVTGPSHQLGWELNHVQGRPKVAAPNIKIIFTLIFNMEINDILLSFIILKDLTNDFEGCYKWVPLVNFLAPVEPFWHWPPSLKWTQGDEMKRIIVCEHFVCLTSLTDKWFRGEIIFCCWLYKQLKSLRKRSDTSHMFSCVWNIFLLRSHMFPLHVVAQIIVCWHNETNCVRRRPLTCPHSVMPCGTPALLSSRWIPLVITHKT